MVQNIENGATRQELTDKTRNFNEKADDIIDGNWEKGQQKTFQKLLEYISQSPQYKHSRHSHSSRENVYEATDQQQVDISGNTGTKPK